MIRVDDTWYTAAVTVPPDALPADLLAVAEPNGARQRFSIAGDPYFAVAVPIDSGHVRRGVPAARPRPHPHLGRVDTRRR